MQIHADTRGWWIAYRLAFRKHLCHHFYGAMRSICEGRRRACAVRRRSFERGRQKAAPRSQSISRRAADWLFAICSRSERKSEEKVLSVDTKRLFLVDLFVSEQRTTLKCFRLERICLEFGGVFSRGKFAAACDTFVRSRLFSLFSFISLYMSLEILCFWLRGTNLKLTWNLLKIHLKFFTWIS